MAQVVGVCCVLARPAWVAANPPVHEPLRIDGVAAYVGGTGIAEGVLVILRSDVELRARLSLLAGGAPDPASVALSPQLLTATLDELVGEALVVLEATRLGLATPSDADVLRERERLVAGRHDALRALMQGLGVSPLELASVARQRAAVGVFLAANLEGTLTLSPAELEEAYQQEDHPFRDEPFATARTRFAAWLAQKRLREGVARWVVSLRERTPYRTLWTFPALP